MPPQALGDGDENPRQTALPRFLRTSDIEFQCHKKNFVHCICKVSSASESRLLECCWSCLRAARSSERRGFVVCGD